MIYRERHLYIYIERERERDGGDTYREHERYFNVCIYTCIERYRENGGEIERDGSIYIIIDR